MTNSMSDQRRKNKPSFEQLKLHPPYRAFRKGRDGVVGLDVESYVTGYAFLITDSLGNYKWIRSADDVVSFLTNESYASSFNVFWNMDFDVSVLLKWLGYEFCRTLIAEGAAWFEGVRFQYVPKRLLLVAKGALRIAYYDVAQFFVPRSLDGASKLFLGDAKTVLPTKEFHPTDLGRMDVLEYCLKDSHLTARLCILLLEELHDIGFSPTTLASPASLVEEAVLSSAYFPDITSFPSGVVEYAYYSYEGGWMECFKKGYAKRLYDYDITSAYPYQMSRLPDLADASFVYRKSCSDLSGVGWVRCTVTITAPVSPIVYRSNRNYTPMGEWDRYLSLDRARFIVEKKLGRVKVHDGWYLTTDLRTRRRLFAPLVWHLFRQREKARLKHLPKMLSVALYGKFAQCDEDGNTGALFMPLYADMITSGTRLQVAEYALMNPQGLCAVSADGLVFDSPLPSSVLSNGMGGLRLSYCSEGVVVGTNVCTIKGKQVFGDWRPGRVDWLKRFRENPDESVYPVVWTRAVLLSEGVTSYESFQKVGRFVEQRFDLDINFDVCRMFLGRPKVGGDLLTHMYESFPWDASMLGSAEWISERKNSSSVT